MSKSKWVCIYKSNSLFQAEVIKGTIETAEIPVVILNKQDSSYLAFGYVEVHVPEEYQQTALAIINNEIQAN